MFTQKFLTRIKSKVKEKPLLVVKRDILLDIIAKVFIEYIFFASWQIEIICNLKFNEFNIKPVIEEKKVEELFSILI